MIGNTVRQRVLYLNVFEGRCNDPRTSTTAWGVLNYTQDPHLGLELRLIGAVQGVTSFNNIGPFPVGKEVVATFALNAEGAFPRLNLELGVSPTGRIFFFRHATKDPQVFREIL